MRIPLLLTLAIGMFFGSNTLSAAQIPAPKAKVGCCTMQTDSEFIASLSGVAHMVDKSFVVKFLTDNGWKSTSFLPVKFSYPCYDYENPTTYRRLTLVQDNPDDLNSLGIFLYDVDSKNVASLWRNLSEMGYRFVRKKTTPDMQSMDNGPYVQNVYYFVDDDGVCAMIYDDEYVDSDLYTLSIYFQHVYNK